MAHINRFNDTDKANLLNSYFKSVKLYTKNLKSWKPTALLALTDSLSYSTTTPHKHLHSHFLSYSALLYCRYTFHPRWMENRDYQTKIQERFPIRSSKLSPNLTYLYMLQTFRINNNFRSSAIPTRSPSHLQTSTWFHLAAFHFLKPTVLECINDWTISISNKKSVTVAYIDYQSAFDCISHPKLLLKLSSYGITGNLYLWIKSLLTSRNQIFKINHSNSTSCHVTSGVVQGSVIGPMLFNIFINDVTNHADLNFTIKLFADDIKIYTDLPNTSHQPTYKHNSITFTNGHPTGKCRSPFPNATLFILAHLTHHKTYI